MKQPTFNGRVLLPMDVIEAARAGDPLALERVLRYYVSVFLILPYRPSPNGSGPLYFSKLTSG